MRHGLAVDGLDTTPFASTRQTSFRAAPPAGKRRGISRRREGEKRIRVECEDTEIRAHSLQHTCTNFSQCANLHEWWLFVKIDESNSIEWRLFVTPRWKVYFLVDGAMDDYRLHDLVRRFDSTFVQYRFQFVYSIFAEFRSTFKTINDLSIV